eukprot:scaffold116297_cov53-Phaeocystis_antarctica.AAC.1
MIVCLILLCLLLCCCACGWYLLCVSVARQKAEDKEKPALVSVASEHTEVKLDIPDNEERWSLIALDKLAKVSGSFNRASTTATTSPPPPPPPLPRPPPRPLPPPPPPGLWQLQPRSLAKEQVWQVWQVRRPGQTRQQARTAAGPAQDEGRPGYAYDQRVA